ncbi:type II toxin-antitoxin system HicA family toxin [Erythrobacter sp. SN021]|uniref:type II toxin-antitoxin system HicA family toxin n=1 Tax=Erythrobacter TaxID=1041 RepID=UPI001F2111A9|nr:type II toxin-antitoxin system HicA family toxin [Erythrobacter sp. SN021]MCF8881931.1 type II toxin-antitoxin system HicA family toxin [Erythrobacter sp. SN021]
MTRIDKLYSRLLTNPRAALSFRELEKLLRAFGFEHDRTKGSHMIWVHPKVPRPFPVQPSGKHAKPYQVREFLEMVEEHGLYIGA